VRRIPNYVVAYVMSRQLKWHVFFAIFLLSWLLYFLLPCLMTDCPLVDLVNLFNDPSDNFKAFLIFNGLIALLMTFMADVVYKGIRRLPRFRPKIGQILIQRGFISQDELNQALRQQKLRIGETLVQAGRITLHELEEALTYQKVNTHQKLGQILKEKKYATDQDIQWALERMRRKLGEILVERGVITNHELHAVLGRMWYARHKGF
jgi:hypothetical protein